MTPPRRYAVYVCSFSGEAFDALTPRQRRDYETVKAAVLEDGRFSAFDATATRAIARIFDRLEADPAVEVYRDDTQFPWLGVRRARGVGR